MERCSCRAGELLSDSGSGSAAWGRGFRRLLEASGGLQKLPEASRGFKRPPEASRGF